MSVCIYTLYKDPKFSKVCIRMPKSRSCTQMMRLRMCMSTPDEVGVDLDHDARVAPKSYNDRK